MPKLSNLLAVNVPRYTSYPTAPHFHSGVGEADYRRWLSELPPGSPLSLYLHIPFCDTLCWFCGCNTTVVNRYWPVGEYVNLLLAEIRLLASVIPSRPPVSHVHWGGGSPTILNGTDFRRLNDHLRLHFKILPSAEFAIEIDPRGLGRTAVKALAQAGLTRASIGLQDCDATVQHAINRVQTEDETKQAITMLRDEGIGSINLDLIYGLPHQTRASWLQTLKFALGLEPDRMAVFGYAHVPQFKKHQALIPEAALPNIEARLEMAQLAQDVITADGYMAIGLDHFAKTGDAMAEAAHAGTLSRNFQGYTTDRAGALLGLGASAIASLPQGYIQNQTTVPLYRHLVRKSQLPIARGIALSEEDKIRRRIIERLMCYLEVDVQDLAPELASTLLPSAMQRLAPLIAAGVVDRQGARIKVPRQQAAALRLVAAAFDDYLPRQKALHSLSI